MVVSVIVTTKNEERHIGSCLESVKKQTYPQESIEIIVVDNNSRDKTKEIALTYTDKVYTCGPERSAQRNFGVQQAKGKYILYLDSDMTLSPDVIKECVDKCESGGCVALYIPERIIGDGFWIKVRDFERGFYTATCIDAVRFVRKDKFSEIGGFDKTLTGPEDWDFDRRIISTGKTAVINACLYHNEGGFCFSKYLSKKKYYGKAFEGYINKWGRNDILIRKQLGLFYRLFVVFMEDGRWKKALVHPLLLSGVYCLRFFVGVGYLKDPGNSKAL